MASKKDKKKDIRVSDRITDSLTEKIISGRIVDGSRLTETDICSDYNISRTPAREALTKLEQIGLVEMIPNKGAVVTKPSKGDLADMDELFNQAQVSAAGYAAERITKEESKKLEEIYGFMKFYTMKDDIPKMITFNSQFHTLIFSLTHDKMLEKLLKVYQKILSLTTPVNYYAPNYLKDVLYEHRAVYEAIQAHDPDRARNAMSRHLESSKKRRLNG
ncbi:MAG: GntR family transcriptional regulator [Eubacteriales bacterium]|nr:GntR family transcriptional regulator [Eubacteriales bacterium]